jgi:hypothetical protein
VQKPVRDNQPEQPSLSRLEILGAWLRVWTPPRDVDVPPIPWRKVAMGAGVLVLLGVFVALVIAPAVDEEKDRSAAERQRTEDRERDARIAAQRREQRAVTGRLTSLAQVEEAIGADAARRFDADGRPADCEPFPGLEPSPEGVLYDCHVVIRELVSAGEQEGARGSLTIPYRARYDDERGRYAFCKVNPRPGEQAIRGPDDVVLLPKPCRAV